MARPRRLTNLPVAALGVAAATLGTVAATMGNGDAIVERGFERALASMADGAGQIKGADLITTTGQPLRVTRTAHRTGGAVEKPVAVGDRVTMSWGGRDRVLRVVKVDQLDGSVLPAAAGKRTPLLLVICEDEVNPASRPVRFLIESDEALPAVTPPATTTART